MKFESALLEKLDFQGVYVCHSNPIAHVQSTYSMYYGYGPTNQAQCAKQQPQVPIINGQPKLFVLK